MDSLLSDFGSSPCLRGEILGLPDTPPLIF
jgi:hypothetical protein